MRDEPTVTVVRFRTDQAEMLGRLLQLYVYDLSDTFPSELAPDGLFHTDDPVSWCVDPNRDAWQIRLDGVLAGFALAMPEGEAWFLDDFFVVRGHRRSGIGRRAARAVFAERPGPWGLTVREPNRAGLQFWRRTLGPAATESPPVIGADGHARIRFVWESER